MTSQNLWSRYVRHFVGITHVTCRLTVKKGDELRNPALGSRVWAIFTFLTPFGPTPPPSSAPHCSWHVHRHRPPAAAGVRNVSFTDQLGTVSHHCMNSLTLKLSNVNKKHLFFNKHTNRRNICMSAVLRPPFYVVLFCIVF